MNAFVRDGAAVYRKKRARQSLCARDTGPESKKIYKTCDDGATPRDLASNTLQMYSGESSVDQSKVVTTEKESRYSNVEFTRAKAFLYLNYKKIRPSNVNKLLKEHLKKFDVNETHLKRTFEQCYDLTGSVEISKSMMKQLSTNTCLRLDLKINVSSGVIERKLSILPRKVVEKTVKKLKKMNSKKSKTIRLREKIDNKNVILFGKEHSSKDKKILYTIKINDYITAPKIDYASDSTIISDDEEMNSSIRITKAYSLHNTNINSFEVTPGTKPNTGIIVSINSNLLKNYPQSNTFSVKKSITASTRLKTSVHKKFKNGPNVCDTENSKISASNMNNLGDINSHQNTDANIQNAESLALETVKNVGKIIVQQFKIDGIVKNFKVPELDKNVEGKTVPHKNSQGLVLARNIDDDEMTGPLLIIDEFVENAENAESSVLETDVEEIMIPKLKDKNVENAALKNDTLGKIIDLELEKSEGPVLARNIDDDEMSDPPLIIDEFVDNAGSTVLETDVEEIMVPKLMDNNVENAALKNDTLGKIIDLELEKSEGPVLVRNIDVDEMTDPPLIIDEFVDNAESTVLETDVEEIIVPKLMDNNVKNAALKNDTLGKIIDLELEKSEGPVLVRNIDDDEMSDPPLIIDEFVDNAESTVLETDVEEIIVPKLMDNNVENAALKNDTLGKIIDLELEKSKGPVLARNIDDDEMTDPPLIIDEFVDNAESTVLETDVEEIMVPKLMDKNVENANSFALQTNTLVGKIIDLELKKSTSGQDLGNSQIDIDIDDSKKQSALETDVGEIMLPKLMDNNVENAALKNDTLGKNIDLELETSTSAQDFGNSRINALKIDTDIDDSEILNHTNIVLKIRKIINTDDKLFKNSIIKDLATYFLNNDFLYKVDALWKTTESDLVGELIIKLLNMFNDTEYNMAQFTSCLICIFREIAQKSSILPCQLKLKLIVFLDAIKKYIKYHDNALWRTWFLPSMFFDWCFIVAFIFMNTKNDFKIDLNKSVIRNSTAYYKMVKQCRYLFINQELKPSKSHKKSGIFELTRIDDLLEIDDVHATNDTKVIPDTSINIPSNELKRKKLNTDDNCMDTINRTKHRNIEKVYPVDPKISKLIVRPQFNYSNSFINKLNWFNGNVSELMKKLNVSTSNEIIGSSTVQNNTTVVGNNEVPSSMNKRRCVILSETNKPTKSKKSKTQVETPRVFFTIANNPKEFDITYSSSAISQKSRSSAVSNNVSSSSTVPKNSSSSAVVPQSLGSSTVSQNLSPYYNHYSSSNTSSQLPVTAVPRSLSVYYNNITSNITQAPIGLQTMPSLSNTTQSSDARSTNRSVNINITSFIHPLHSSNQKAKPHPPKAANTWPSNKYTNMCSYPSCSESSTYPTQYTNSASSSQAPYNYNIPPGTSHPQYSNVLSYPSTYTNPLIRNLLASNTANVASMNTLHQNYNYNNSYSSQNNLKTPDHNTQVSPDLPDARLPNMPNHHAADTINQKCMAANCANFSSYPCNNCLAAFYCSEQCQQSDWHYHQNECCLSF